MDLLAYRNKFKKLFDQLSKPGYVLDPHYADKLIVKLQATSDPEISQLLSSPFFPDLLLEALLQVETADVAVIAFYLKLITSVSTNELQFAKLCPNPGFTLLTKVADISQLDIAPSIRVAFIEMAATLATHNAGVTWLLETQAWKHIFNLCYQSQTVYVLRAAYKFSGDFLWILNDFADEDSLVKVLEYILKPINESPYKHAEIITEEEEPSYTTPLFPSLHMLMAALKNINNICHPNVVSRLLTKHFIVKYNLSVILHITRNEELILLISKIVFLIALTAVFQNKDDQTQDNSLLDLSICFFNTVHLHIQKRLVTLLLDYSISCNMYCSQVWLNNSLPQIAHNGKTFDIQSQVILCPLVPIICYVKQHLSPVCNEFLNEYIRKLLTISCEHTTRAAYALRDLIAEFDCSDIALQSTKRLFLLKNHLNQMQANAIFQCLFYVLKDFVPIDDSGNIILNTVPERIESKQNILSQAIDVIMMLLKCHNINWHESFELVCLYNAVCNILKVGSLQTRLELKILSLITLTVKKFIPPNLALLLESKDGSPLHEIGELMYHKLHDRAWEVRDSALELLCECTEIAFIKYIPFQKLILENNLISLAATIALNDCEFYVQASALKCIAAATKIQTIWDDLLIQHPNFYVNLTSLFKNNAEGLVRKEAIDLMCKIFQNQKVNENFKNCLCKCMVSAALDDLHWEVQLTALKYWQNIINNQLSYQGMIDGKFPAVTFSRDKRKIVNLTKFEIQKNLATVLENLADNGCLKVLLKTLEEDVDVDVMEASLAISQDFLKILDHYNVADIIKSEIEPEIKTESSMNVLQAESFQDCEMKNSDEIIEEILDSDDINLLSSIYESKLNVNENKEEEDLDCFSPIVTNQRVAPYKFLMAFRNNDYNTLIGEKRKWNAGVRSLHSVLDDVLGLYDNTDVNSLDCY